MGTAIGHVLAGTGYFLVGLWHLINHIKLHAINPNSYISLTFFPISNKRYLEPYLMMGASGFYIIMELVIGQIGHHVLDADGSITHAHMRNFEHAFISLWLFVYAAFTIILDKFSRSKSKYGLTLSLAFVAFGQDYLLFYFHSTDHMGLEGHYHRLLQFITLLSVVSTGIGISHRRSFLVSFVRSFSLFFKGFWYIVMGIELWSPALTPKGCSIVKDESYKVKCSTKEALDRAKALTTLQFSWFLVLFVVLTMCLYLYMIRIYPEKVGYELLIEENFDTGDDHDHHDDKKETGQEKKRRQEIGV